MMYKNYTTVNAICDHYCIMISLIEQIIWLKIHKTVLSMHVRITIRNKNDKSRSYFTHATTQNYGNLGIFTRIHADHTIAPKIIVLTTETTQTIYAEVIWWQDLNRHRIIIDILQPEGKISDIWSWCAYFPELECPLNTQCNQSSVDIS